MNADGSDERKLPIDTTYPPSENEELVFVADRDPAWSPEGTRIAFYRVADHYGDGFAYDEYTIRTVDADGSGPLGSYGRARYDAHRAEGPELGGVRDGAPRDDHRLRPLGRGRPRREPRVRLLHPRLEHNFQVRAKGPGGEIDPTPAEHTWTVEAPEPPPDADGPAITPLRPAPSSSTRDRTPTIRATVRDRESELAASDMRLRVDDGAKKAFAYDPDTERLSRTTGKLSYGRHSVKVVARDAAGNATARAWSFRVVRGR